MFVHVSFNVFKRKVKKYECFEQGAVSVLLELEGCFRYPLPSIPSVSPENTIDSSCPASDAPRAGPAKECMPGMRRPARGKCF